jgi:hypothetical protein
MHCTRRRSSDVTAELALSELTSSARPRPPTRMPSRRRYRSLMRGAVPVALTCRFRVSHAAHGRRTIPCRPDPRYRLTAGVASRRARVRARVGPMLPIGIPSLALISR